jgi:hypothetical protein
MNNRTMANQKTDTEDVLRKGTRSGESEGAFAGLELEGEAVLPDTQLLATTPSPGQVMRMQQMVGNRAVQQMLKPATAKPETAAHAPGCTCPGCAAQMRTVIDDKAHAPAMTTIQREASGHDAACGCPTCVGARAAAAPTALIQREAAAGGAGGAGGAGAGFVLEEEEVAEESSIVMDIGLPIQMGENPDDRSAPPGEEEEVPATAVAPERTQGASGFTDAGQVGTASAQITDRMPDDDRPHIFIDGGQTGTVVWAGGGGAGPRGNQNVGSLQHETPPIYDTGPDPDDATKFVAWLRPATGLINVTRSWLGAITGDQGNGQYVSAGAAARFNNHENQHVVASKSLYDSLIQPMLDRAWSYLPGGQTMKGDTAEAAANMLKAVVSWEIWVKAWQDADIALNTPMGTIDTNDLASGTYPENRGAVTIAGKAYTNAVASPGEALPAP